MGLATAEAVVRAGYTLVPYTLTGRSRGVSVSKQAVNGIPVELVGPEERQQAVDRIRKEYPNMVVIDYTLPSCVNGEPREHLPPQEPCHLLLSSSLMPVN
jgi:4-hydroxy-tetrahydrodipicolinate reductase